MFTIMSEKSSLSTTIYIFDLCIILREVNEVNLHWTVVFSRKLFLRSGWWILLIFGLCSKFKMLLGGLTTSCRPTQDTQLVPLYLNVTSDCHSFHSDESWHLDKMTLRPKIFVYLSPFFLSFFLSFLLNTVCSVVMFRCTLWTAHSDGKI